ncbi:MAG: NADH-quinone oxidoreductase subunit M [Sulfobacillus thermosulfidooxidans]|uniref:NADH-quinone oxidoreductase subunit M n=1 Tax=Sulfobacillus thermosulfidooxidans TaxID=28034 RepID=A0A2T2WTM3_SULTH|nr:MAG: NADH-quinone oxidoreductase subunit M [Sulfobacillus thermosulfidooxidans]
MLSLLIIPLMFMIVLPWIPQPWQRYSFVSMALAEGMVAWMGLTPGQFIEVKWWSTLGLNWSLGVTRYNEPLLWLNGVVLLSTAWAQPLISKESLFWLSLADIGVTLAFLSQNLLGYFLGFEMAVLPFFLWVRKEGGIERRVAAFYYLGFSAVAGMFLLAAILVMVVHHVIGFSAAPLPRSLQVMVYGLLLVTWAIKTPLWPFHLWLPRTHGQASTAASMYLSGVALKVAPYGLLLFSQLMPQIVHHIAPWLALWGAISLLIGSLLALAQRDLKQTIALSSIASMGYVLIALSWGTVWGNQIAILVMIGHGLASPLLFWVSGRIERALGSRNLDDLVGFYQQDPVLTIWLTLAAFTYMGIPGLALFPGEFGVVTVAMQHDRHLLYLIAPAILTMTATWLRILARARFGPVQPPTPSKASPSVRWGGFWLGVPLLLVGLIPGLWIHLWQWGGR